MQSFLKGAIIDAVMQPGFKTNNEVEAESIVPAEPNVAELQAELARAMTLIDDLKQEVKKVKKAKSKIIRLTEKES